MLSFHGKQNLGFELAVRHYHQNEQKLTPEIYHSVL